MAAPIAERYGVLWLCAGLGAVSTENAASPSQYKQNTRALIKRLFFQFDYRYFDLIRCNVISCLQA